MNIVQELHIGTDAFQGELCSGCGKFYKQRLALFQAIGWGSMYVLCKKCVTLKRAGKITEKQITEGFYPVKDLK